MPLFRKKKSETTVQFVPPECRHKYRDFDWYIDERWMYDEYRRKIYDVRVIEPYVCIHCKKRIDKVLFRDNYLLKAEHDALIERLRSEHSQIKPQEVVEDQIADMQLVDREYLEIAQNIFPKRDIL